MLNLLAILGSLLFAVPLSFGQETVRISLFTLFKPETLHVRIVSGDSAILTLTGLASSQLIRRGESIRIRLSGDRLNVLAGDLHAGVKQSVATEAQIMPSGPATLELIIPGRMKRVVRGALSVDSGNGGNGPLRIVLTADREAAVASVVAAESSHREKEALNALAVVVRTFMISQRSRHIREGFDFCDTTHCQLYRGEDYLGGKDGSRAITGAVSRTAGQFLGYKGRPVESYYSAVCGGFSATPSMVWGGGSHYPYARIECRWCQSSPFYRWERSTNSKFVVDSLSAFMSLKLSPSTEIVLESDPASGFVRSVIVRDTNKQTSMSADAFRRAIGLRLGWNTVLSPTFSIERRGARLIFRGRGFGSQIGLCEAGAVAQARAHRSYREILNFYYPGTDIVEQAAHD